MVAWSDDKSKVALSEQVLHKIPFPVSRDSCPEQPGTPILPSRAPSDCAAEFDRTRRRIDACLFCGPSRQQPEESWHWIGWRS
jgi:hypothetical protein